MDTELMPIIKKAVDFHGHMGPFLVMGVRTGLIGVRELGVKGNDKKLRVTAMLRNSVPFSCVIDGIQVATKCTIGNKKLRLRSSLGIAAKFELPSREQVTVAVDPTAFDRLKNELPAENVHAYMFSSFIALISFAMVCLQHLTESRLVLPLCI